MITSRWTKTALCQIMRRKNRVSSRRTLSGPPSPRHLKCRHIWTLNICTVLGSSTLATVIFSRGLSNSQHQSSRISKFSASDNYFTPLFNYFLTHVINTNRSHWPSGLKRGSTAARFAEISGSSASGSMDVCLL